MPRAFLHTLLAVNACLAAAGAIYAVRAGIPAATAAPIMAAFLLQISFYLVPGFPEVRRRLEERFSPARLAAITLAASVAPYVVYSVPTGVFRISGLLQLAAVCAAPLLVFVARPTRSARLTWQDLVACAAIAGAMLSRLFRQIYLSPVEGLRVYAMGRLMIVAVGATAFLSLRRLEGSGFQLRPSGADCKEGIRQFLWFLPIGVAVAWGTGFGRFRLLEIDPWIYPALAAGTFLGMYAVVALSEELFFRGILQNLGAASLGNPLAAQALAAVLYGLSHLPFRQFPNWRFALVSAVAGWFFGQAYRRRSNVVAAAMAHALVATVWQLFFGG